MQKIKNKNGYAAFMGHNVYTHKVFVAELIASGKRLLSSLI